MLQENLRSQILTNSFNLFLFAYSQSRQLAFMFHLEIHNLFIIMTINPLPSDTKVWDMFERWGYARRHIINVEWDSAYYSSSFYEGWEWTEPKIQYFNFCTIARLRDWCEASEPKIKEYKTTDLWLAEYIFGYSCYRDTAKTYKNKPSRSV